MRIFPRATLVVLLLLGPVAGTAMAVTTAQLVELSKAGLSDEVLIALIETDGSTFQLSAADILQLHRAGLSNGVILAMQKAGQNNVRVVRPTEPQDFRRGERTDWRCPSPAQPVRTPASGRGAACSSPATRASRGRG